MADGAAAPTPAPTPAPVLAAAPAAPAPKPIHPNAVPESIKALYRKHSEKSLLKTRFWPTELWKDPFSLPGYRRAAYILAAIIAGFLAVGVIVGELSPIISQVHEGLHRILTPLGVPVWIAETAWIFIKAVVVLHILLFNGLFMIWWERKISAHIQSRMGPMFVGGWHGWLQTAADGLKLMLKEDAAPSSRDHWLHRLAPAIVFIPVLLCFVPVPFGKELESASLDVGILYIFAVAGISVLGIVMAGWSSSNKYSLLGGLRSAAQLVSYELPRAFSIVPMVAMAGSLSLTQIVAAQSGYWLGVLPKWFIFYPVVGQISFVIFLIASVAETNRTPFDIAEAESELVAGFHTEFSGMKWSIFFLTEYAYVLLASMLLTTFFVGGGEPPLPFLSFIPSWIWFLGKTLVFLFSFLWFRWTFPRFRVDRLMDFNWKFLLPWSIANIAFAVPYIYWIK